MAGLNAGQGRRGILPEIGLADSSFLAPPPLRGKPDRRVNSPPKENKPRSPVSEAGFGVFSPSGSAAVRVGGRFHSDLADSSARPSIKSTSNPSIKVFDG